jgi:hypothetical protein
VQHTALRVQRKMRRDQHCTAGFRAALLSSTLQMADVKRLT